MRSSNFYFSIFFLFVKLLLWAQGAKSQSNINNTIPYHVGVVLDSSSPMGQMANICISMGFSDFYRKFSSYKTRVVLHYRDSQGDPLQALSQVVDLLQKYEVQAIIGPQSSTEAEFLVNLGVKSEIPIISFSATSPLISHAKTPYFVRVTNNDNYQVKHIASLVQNFQWREVVLIYEDSIFGYGIVPELISAFDEIQARVPYRSVISPLANDNEITIELYKLMTMSTRVFVVHMSPNLAYRVFLKLNDLGMMSKGYVWIVTDGITNSLSSINSSLIASMPGVLGFRPYMPPSKKLNDFFSRWRNETMKIDDFNRYCLWAYDAAWALTISAEKLGISRLGNSTKSPWSLGSLISIPISQTGSRLLKVLSDIEFDGISGPVVLKNGERKPLPYEIINIVGHNIRKLGYITTENGISQNLEISNNKTDLDTYAMLSPVWPGDSIESPTGWVIPVTAKKLKIGVPLRIGFQELVKVEFDSKSRTYKVSGFCIDVFRYAIELLPYDVAYEFIPFVNANGTEVGDYNDLINQVYLQKLDAVVGDITITSNRSSYVDFTISFIGGGTAMVVPTLNNNGMWVFLEPLTVDLWVVIFGFFVSTGIVVWAIECGTNDNLKGPFLVLPGKIFSHSVSNLVFAPGENLSQSFSKLVVIVWFFAALILASSYTANLSSILTTQRLLKFPKGGLIGYRPPSIVTKLFSNLNFENTKMNPCDSEKDYADALNEGSRHGGVSAIIDEIPYIRIFLAKYPIGYTMINATEDTSGFGFVFPKRSPMVPDLSGAIAKLRENGRLEMLQQFWFGNQKIFIVDNSAPNDNVLGFHNFRGLFLIMGTTLILALLISRLFLKNVTCDEKKEEVKIEENEENVIEENVLNLPCDDSPLTIPISDQTSDDNISIEEFDNHTNNTTHVL